MATHRKTRSSAAAADVVAHLNEPSPSTVGDPDALVRFDDKTESVWLSRLAGRPFTWRRSATAFVVGFVVATLARQLCFSRFVFGTHLAKNLAPVERDNVEWSLVGLGAPLRLDC